MAAKKTAGGAKRGSATGARGGAKAGSAGDRPKLRSSHGGPGLGRGASSSGGEAGERRPARKTAGAAGAKSGKPVKARPFEGAVGARDTREKPEARRPVAKKAAKPRSLGASPRAQAKPTPSSSLATDEARQLAVLIAIAALDKKAVGLEILDVAGKVDYADFLVLMTGRSDRQVAALADGIEEALRQKDRRPVSVEGKQRASWVLMDYGDVVVHVFQDDARSLYDIEGLWLDARRVPVPMPEGLR